MSAPVPWNERSDRRYEATREDVLRAMVRTEPDPFGMDRRPWTEFLIAVTIAETRRLWVPGVHLGRVLKRNRLRELLEMMSAEGSLVGLPRRKWAAMGLESPSRASDMLYATPAQVSTWTGEENL